MATNVNNTNVKSQSFPFLSILCLIFITLKLTGYIVWSWWWVLAPIWIPFVVVVGVVALYAIAVKVFYKYL